MQCSLGTLENRAWNKQTGLESCIRNSTRWESFVFVGFTDPFNLESAAILNSEKTFLFVQFQSYLLDIVQLGTVSRTPTEVLAGNWRGVWREGRVWMVSVDVKFPTILLHILGNLPSPWAPVFRAACAIQVTWSGRVCESFSPPFYINQKGLGRRILAGYLHRNERI